MFVREDWTLFRNLSTIGQKAGVSTGRLPMLVAKELADNALDATGACSYGLLDGGDGLFVEDQGEGIPGTDPELADMFSIARPLASSKLLRLPTRGALGNGLRVVTGVVLASGGALSVFARGRALRLCPQDDGRTLAEPAGPWDRKGTRVEVRFGPAPLPLGGELFAWAERARVLAEGGVGYKGLSSPWWYDEDSFFELCRAARDRSARELVGELDGCTGAKAGLIASAYPGRPATSLSREEAAALLSAARGRAKQVAPERLGSVGRKVLGLAGYAYARGHYEFRVESARGNLSAHLPCVIEAWAAPVAGKPSFLAHVNRTPAALDLAAWKDKNDLRLYGGELNLTVPAGRRSLEILLNVQTPFMPITTDGKAPNFGYLSEAIEAVVTKAVRGARRYTLADAGRPASQKDVILAALPEAITKASGDGRYRFSLRQLFYAVRPAFLASIGKEPDYGYFAGVVADYEAGTDIPGIYRDARGTLYHPHTGEEIPLGTLSVEGYARPAWTFNKILYCEKEGFFSILRAIRWPERHDCALVSSKGFASRAARDVLDLLGERGEELAFFCIHDADGPGTKIYESPQEGTRARPGRRVRIINLGLEPEEALAMSLQVEAVERKDGRSVPVAEYVSPAWRRWLQSHRAELNAMSTPDFVAWLDRKMAEHDRGKVVPPAEVMEAQFRQDLEGEVRRRITRALLRRARVAERTRRAVRSCESEVVEALAALSRRLAVALQDSPAKLWREPLGRLAREVARDMRLARPQTIPAASAKAASGDGQA
jgi:hypothetical protein